MVGKIFFRSLETIWLFSAFLTCISRVWEKLLVMASEITHLGGCLLCHTYNQSLSLALTTLGEACSCVFFSLFLKKLTQCNETPAMKKNCGLKFRLFCLYTLCNERHVRQLETNEWVNLNIRQLNKNVGPCILFFSCQNM